MLLLTMWLLLLLTPILILLKLQSSISSSWPVVLIPLWILLACVPTCAPLLGLLPFADDSEGASCMMRPDDEGDAGGASLPSSCMH